MEKKLYANISYYCSTQAMGAYATEIYNLPQLMEDFKFSDAGDKYIIEFIEMTEEEFNNLPEFSGF